MASETKPKLSQKIPYANLIPVFVIIVALMFPSMAVAEEEHAGSDHSLHKHHVALFLGNTQDEHGDSGISVGVDYEHRINKWLGVGGFVEYAGGDLENLRIGIPLFIHPYKEWRLLAAIGGEIYKDQVSNEKDRGFVFRTGVGYLFPVGKDITVAPEFFVDFSEHETLFTYGLSVGYGF